MCERAKTYSSAYLDAFGDQTKGSKSYDSFYLDTPSVRRAISFWIDKFEKVRKSLDPILGLRNIGINFNPYKLVKWPS